MNTSVASYCVVAFTVVLLGVLLFATGAGAQDDFFAPAVVKGADLPADKVFPQGRLFPFGGYSGVAAREASNNFTLHGPVYGDANNSVIANAEAASMYAIYSVGIPMNFLEAGGRPALDLSEAQIVAEIKRQVDAVVDKDVIAWWYLTPEELRPWRTKEMRYLEVAARTIRENDPLKRPVWMYDPGHRTSKELAVTAQFLDIVGKGMYTNYSGQKGHRVWNRWTIEQQISAIDQSGRPSAIQIAVPEMFQEPAPEDVAKIPAWVRHDVYLALVSGAQGVVPFSLAYRSGFSSQAWDAYYNAYAQTAHELNGAPGLGQVFLFGERRHDLHLTITAGERVVSPQLMPGVIDKVIEYPAVAMANIAYGSDRYLFLVNSSEEPVEVRIDGFPVQPVYVRDAFSGMPTPPITSTITLTLPGLGVSGMHLARGYVWLASPQPKETVDRAVVPVQIEAPGISLRSVKVTLNGATLYGGARLPVDLRLRTAELAVGKHEIVVTVTDDMGRVQDYPFDFTVEHFRLNSPHLEWGERLAGTVPLQLALMIAPDELKNVSVELRPISESEKRSVSTLYAGATLPERLDFDTTVCADGAYDLAIGMTTVAGITSVFNQRIVIDNWETLEDQILPPITNSWFGTREQWLVVERSDGWEFTGAAPEIFFGDDGRIRRRSDTEEHLTWRMPKLRQFTFIMYARRPNLAQQVTVAISLDGQAWQEVPYSMRTTEQPDSDLLKLELAGTLPAEMKGEYIRLTIFGNNSAEDALELGHVLLAGVKG